jgi:hypothetical protein
MTLVEELLNSSFQDTQVLYKNDELGDNFSVYRNVEFIFYTKDEKKAEIVSSFISDNRYATATYAKLESNFRILAVSHMPINQNIICSVSGLMTCIAKLFNVEYDGWGSAIPKTAQQVDAPELATVANPACRNPAGPAR